MQARVCEPSHIKEPPGDGRSKPKGTSVAKVGGFKENPIMLEGEAGEIGRAVMICLADAEEAREQCADRHVMEINLSLAFSPSRSSM